MSTEIYLAIVGSRNFIDYPLFNKHMTEWVNKYGLPKLVISGGAKGADTLGKQWADANSIPTKIFLPDWKTYGRAAGPIRNTDIINAATHVIAFPTSDSIGTKDSIQKAKKSGKILEVINV